MRIKALLSLAGCAVLALGAPAIAQTPPSTPAAPATPPKLLVVISVDQFSADLFNEYRPYYTEGLKRLQQGVVFPKAYQSHASTETCPGHSTILTGNRPAHTGIIANSWVDQSVTRAEKVVYCSEDPNAPGATARSYVASPMRLRVPTLGGRMKAANPAAKVISVAGKDRAAIMMGGPKLDQIWWWGGKGFASYAGTQATPLVANVNGGVMKMLGEDRPAMELPELCKTHDYPIEVAPGVTVGTGRFARKANDERAFRVSPEFDAAVLVLAESLIEDQKLGKGATTDLISIGLSANDYVGHTFGTEGAEMCLQQMSLDRELGAFLERLDKTGVDYMVVLTADHGGQDAAERLRANGIDDAQRLDPGLSIKNVNALVAAKTGLTGDLLLGEGGPGDWYANKTLSAADRKKVLTAAAEILRANKQVAAVFTQAEISAAPEPAGPPESWTLLTEVKASFDPERSGDLVLLLKPRVTPVADASRGTVAGHGSAWDYDRRVPMLFWRKGLPQFEQPQGVETVDIMPTLAAQIGLALPPKGPGAGYDGRCLDLSVGAPGSCPAK
ncbi:MAG: alkaline phosphatase family protein [Sphingobium sp.]|nr:alkaline phosphatase family protein [Sphingobium sp.]